MNLKKLKTLLTIDIIEDELARLQKDYTESAGVIWTLQNTEKVKELVNSIQFEKALTDQDVLEKAEEEYFINEMHEGEVIIDGIILRLYNEKPPTCFEWNNESFIQKLLRQLRNNFNEYLSISSFISNSENEEAAEFDESTEVNYFSKNRIPKSELEKYDSDNIDLYKERVERLGYEITLVMTSILLNININLSQKDIESESAFHPYTEEFINEVFAQEVEHGIFEILKCSDCNIVRCTLLQIFALVSD